MWKALIDVNQLDIGSKIRLKIADGAFERTSIYRVEKIYQHYFTFYIIEKNEQEIPLDEQVLKIYLLKNLLDYGFDIWED